MHKYLKLLVSLTLVFAVAFAGSLVTTPALPGWYESLNKPFFNPPNWLFAPVWTLLFLLMGISSYLIWTKDHKNSIKALRWYYLQLFLNLLWSALFFGLQSPLLALFEVVVFWWAILTTIKAFRPISTWASNLLIPYLLWVSFAALLNLAIVLLN